MAYYEVTPHALFNSCISEWGDRDDPLARACAWVDAVNKYDVFELYQQWFDKMETGEAFRLGPDPSWDDDEYPDKRPLTLELATKYLEELDADFLIEKNRFRGRKAPEFSRIAGTPASLAFMQQVYRVQKTSSQIQKEAQARLAAGQELPPSIDAQTEEVLTRKGTLPPK